MVGGVSGVGGHYPVGGSSNGLDPTGIAILNNMISLAQRVQQWQSGGVYDGNDLIDLKDEANQLGAHGASQGDVDRMTIDIARVDDAYFAPDGAGACNDLCNNLNSYLNNGGTYYP